VNKANINSMIIMNSAQELVISFEPASGESVVRSHGQVTASHGIGIHRHQRGGKGSSVHAYHRGQYLLTLAL